jgi:membrane dipeptidase
LVALAEGKTTAEIHREILIFDPHTDLPSPYDWKDASGPKIPELRGNQITAASLKAGGYDAIGLAVFVPQTERNDQTTRLAKEEALLKLGFINSLSALDPEAFEIAHTPDEIRAAEAAGKTAIVPTILNAFPLGSDADALKGYYDQGVRILGLTHAGNNDFADSNRPQARDKVGENGGLSDAGRQLIKKANELGVLVDVSQISDEAFDQVLDLTTAPVIASHSGIYARSPSPRSLTDKELDRIKENGGVVAVVAFSSYLVTTPPEVAQKIAAVQAKYGAVNGYEGLTVAQRESLAAERDALRPKATVADLVDAIDYAVKRIGIDHVAISSDFNHGGGVVGFEDASHAPAVTAELVERGYSADDVAKLWGGNVLRVLGEAQAAGGKV